jgi:hypothetical protein
MTDAEILTQIQRVLVETADGGLTVSSGLWTPAELQDALNNGKQYVRTETVPFLERVTLPAVPNQIRYALPQDWVATQRVVWHSADGSKMDLPRDSTWSMDYMEADWPVVAQGRPQVYTDTITPMPQIQVMPPSRDNGVLEVLYLSTSTVLPDLMIPIAKWRAVAILLAKDGRGQDLPRAKKANDLAEQGVQALNIFLKGWR